MHILYVRPMTATEPDYDGLNAQLEALGTRASLRQRDGTPIREDDGTQQVQIPDAREVFRVKHLLRSGYGLTIAREWRG